MTKHEHGAQAICEACTFEPFVKNNYFTGKMMGAAEFIAESRYHQEKLRLHQVRLHGWGVVCGLDVVQHPNADCRRRYVVVKPGSAIDCCGHDILVPEEEVVDLLADKKVVALAKENPARLHALGICVKFEECTTENVPVLYDDCGCNDDSCAPNRILETYKFEVLVDPPLTGLKTSRPDDIAGAVFVRPPDTGLAASTPRMGRAALIGSTLYALDASNKPTKLVAFDLLTRHGDQIDLGANAYSLAAQAGFVFVATAPKSGGTAPIVQVFKPGTDGALTTIELSGVAAANPVLIDVTSDATRNAVAYVPATGALFGIPADATNGLVAPAAPLGSIAANLSSFATSPDGTAAFGVDVAAGTVSAIALSAASTATNVASIPANAKISALTYWESGGKKKLAAASEITKQLYIVDIGAGTLLATIPLDYPPEFLAIGADDIVEAIEEDGGAAFLQSIDVGPLATNQPAIVGAPRMIDGSGERLVVFNKNGTAGIAGSFDRAELPCDELSWHQCCSPCDSANCVMLATIERYAANDSVLDADPAALLADDIANHRARIDNREGRKVLASTQTLQAWIECLELKGVQGPPGKDGQNGTNGANGLPGQNGQDGIGLFPDLPKILDIGWRFEQTIDIRNFMQVYQQLLAQNDPAAAVIAAVKANKPPPLTIYFNKTMTGVTTRTLGVSVSIPMPVQDANQNWVSAGVYLPIDLRLFGDIVPVPGPVPTPHTGEQAAFAVSFLPRPRFFTTTSAAGQQTMAWPFLLIYYLALINRNSQDKLEPPQMIVSLKGDFVYVPGPDIEKTILDAENIAGMVGDPTHTRPAPITGGKNPSGNLAQGGLFESWFFLTANDDFTAVNNSLKETNFAAINPATFGLHTVPPVLSLASADEITQATGITAALAKRIVKERDAAPFESVDDLKSRLQIATADMNKLKSKLLFL
jgi:type II secretion system (T2SS) protein K